nr:DUF4041 domain-containing protein [Streptomyces sp. NP160]
MTTAPAPDAEGVEAPAARDHKVGFFGARKAARSLAQEVDQLRAELDRLGVLDIVELERRRDELSTEVAALTARSAEELAAHQHRLAEETEKAGYIQQRKVAVLEHEVEELARRKADLEQHIVQTEDLAILQEAGIYSYRHRLGDSVAHQAELKRIQDQAKAMTRRDGGAVSATTNWQVNGSAAKGRTMVNDISKLMLRAYNAEADDLARTMKPYKLDSSVERLEKVVTTIERLGRSMSIRISPGYHRLRVQELELTADFIELQAEEKAREREEKERLREERKAQQELDRERDRLLKEKQHYANALAALEAKGDAEGAARLREQVEDLERAIEDVDYRAANVRAGYVYVISNMGGLRRQHGQGRHDPAAGAHGPHQGTLRRLGPLQLRRARAVLLERRGGHRGRHACEARGAAREQGQPAPGVLPRDTGPGQGAPR